MKRLIPILILLLVTLCACVTVKMYKDSPQEIENESIGVQIEQEKYKQDSTFKQ